MRAIRSYCAIAAALWRRAPWSTRECEVVRPHRRENVGRYGGWCGETDATAVLKCRR